jgi:AcrR family transcriptional regulator
MVDPVREMAVGKSVRGRPRMSESVVADVRKQIIERAKNLFQTEGYGAVSMRRLAAETNRGVATIYEYFPSKADLLRHIWADFFDEIFRRISDAGRARSGLAALKAMAAAYAEYWFEHPDRFRMVFFNEDRSEQGEPLFVHRFSMKARLRPLLTAIEEGQAAGEIIPGDPVTLLQVLVGFVHGAALNLITISEFEWVARDQIICTALSLLEDRRR